MLALKILFEWNIRIFLIINILMMKGGMRLNEEESKVREI